MNDNSESIIELIEMLYNMISEAWGVPLGQDKCLIERDKALDLIEEIKARFPAEMAEAKRLVSARDEFIGNAKREAESVRKVAEDKSRKLVDEQEIVKKAQLRADEIIADAQTKSVELRRAASEYVDETLRNAESAVSAAMDSIRQSRSKIRAVNNPVQEKIEDIELSLEEEDDDFKEEEE